jgi:hypothetical protein
MLPLRLQECHLLDETVKVTAFRSRQNDCQQFFITQGELRAFKNVEVVMAAMNIRHDPKEQRQFADSSMHSSAVAQGKGTALNPFSKCQPQEGNICKHEERSQPRELNNI